MPDFLPPDDDEQELAQTAPSALAVLSQSEHAAMVQTANLQGNRRKLADFESRLMSYATHSQPIAIQMFYSLPRAGKQVIGPSIRFAEITAPAWKNCAVASRVVDASDTMVTSQGIFIDYEANLRNSIEVPRRITDKDGKRYSSDMIVTTANAAMSVARRNAVLKGGVPQALWTPAYEAAMATAVGKASSHAQRVADAMDFLHKLGLTEWQILNAVGVPSVRELETEHLVTLRVLVTEIKRGDKTLEQVFGSQHDKEIEALFVQLKMNSTQQTMLKNSYMGRAEELVKYLRERVGAPPAAAPQAAANAQATAASPEAPAPKVTVQETKPARQTLPPLGTVKDGKTITGPDGKLVQQWNPLERAQQAVAEPVVETKVYSDGTTATGPGPLPDESPAQQDRSINMIHERSEDVLAASAGLKDALKNVAWDEMGAKASEGPGEQGPVENLDAEPVEESQPVPKRRGRPTREEMARRTAAAQGNPVPETESSARERVEDLVEQTDKFAF